MNSKFRSNLKALLRYSLTSVLALMASSGYAGTYNYYINSVNDLANEINNAISIRNNNFPNDTLVINLHSAVYSLSNCGIYCIDLNQVQDVTIKGAGASSSKLLVLGQNQIGKGIIRVENSDNVHIEGISLNYEYKPFFQGEVTYNNGTLLSVRPIGTKLADPNSLKNGSGHGIVYDPLQMGVRKQDTGTYIEGNPNISYDPSVDRYYFNYLSHNHQVNNWINVGDHFVYTARVAKRAISISNNSNISVKNTTIHASPGGAIVGELNSGQQVFENIQIVPESNHIISSNADGFHFADSKSSITIRNNTVRSTGDDGLAIYNKGMKMHLQSGSSFPNSFSVIRSQNLIALKRLEVGQVLQFVDVQNNKLLLNSQIEVIVDDPIADRYFIRVKSSLYDEMLPNNDVRIYNLSLSGSNSQITNNMFDSVRRAGINLKSRYASVTGNTFKNVDTWGIAAHVEQSALNSGPLPHGHTVTGNTFNGLGPLSSSSNNPVNIRIGLFSPSNPTSCVSEGSTLGNILSGNTYLNGGNGYTCGSAHNILKGNFW